MYSLHVGDVAFQKVYDARRENKRRKDGEKNGKTCGREQRRNRVKVNSFTFRRNFLNETRLGKWDSCVNSRSRWRLLTHSAVHQSTEKARGRNVERRERKFTFATRISFSAKLCCFFYSFTSLSLRSKVDETRCRGFTHRGFVTSQIASLSHRIKKKSL